MMDGINSSDGYDKQGAQQVVKSKGKWMVLPEDAIALPSGT